MTTPVSADLRFAALVFNPIKVDASDLQAAVISASHAAGWGRPLLLATSVEDPGENITREALDAGASVILVAGGDGTVRAVAGAMISSGVPLAIVPSGTGNLLARNLQLPLSSRDAMVNAAFTGDTTQVDIGVASVTRPDGSTEKHPFVVMAGIGMDAAMIRNTRPELKKSVGWVAYVDGAARSLTQVDPFRVMFQVDGGRIETTRAHSVLWANCGLLPAGIQLVPGASITDGRLDVAIFRPRSWWGWLAVWRTVWWQNSVLHRTEAGRRVIALGRGSKAVKYLQGVAMEAAVGAPQPIELDGDELGMATTLEGRIVPGGLSVKVPVGHKIAAR